MVACRMNDNNYNHIPVLLNEAISALVVSKEGTYLDMTFGRGSHSRAILDCLNANGRLIAFDKDSEAVQYAKQTIHDKRFSIVHSSFVRMQIMLNEFELMGKVDGILFDLGVSSPQLDNPDRGFSFVREGKLDMRMDTSQGIPAMRWLVDIKEAELANVLWQYGEEKYSRRIAKAIVMTRQETPITTTTQLAEIIKSAIPKPKKYEDKHPATRSFQAIRIAVNQELIELEKGLTQAFDGLKAGGRLAVISFHSLEDRIVKQFIKHHEVGEQLPRGLPIKGEKHHVRMKSICKPIKPAEQEVNDNPRARSAILRIAEKIS
jgi:16S rRNA (cytosine1402-N4)-methyltransferase